MINTLADNLRRFHREDGTYGFGDMLDAMRPRPPRVRSSLTNQVEHVHDVAAFLLDVYVAAGTPLSKVYGSAPDAGEVRIEYDATTGVPTLTFNAATTTYAVVEMGPVPTTISEVMDTEVGA
jgi:hypothetical protein